MWKAFPCHDAINDTIMHRRIASNWHRTVELEPGVLYDLLICTSAAVKLGIVST